MPFASKLSRSGFKCKVEHCHIDFFHGVLCSLHSNWIQLGARVRVSVRGSILLPVATRRSTRTRRAAETATSPRSTPTASPSSSTSPLPATSGKWRRAQPGRVSVVVIAAPIIGNYWGVWMWMCSGVLSPLSLSPLWFFQIDLCQFSNVAWFPLSNVRGNKLWRDRELRELSVCERKREDYIRVLYFVHTESLQLQVWFGQKDIFVLFSLCFFFSLYGTKIENLCTSQKDIELHVCQQAFKTSRSPDFKKFKVLKTLEIGK